MTPAHLASAWTSGGRRPAPADLALDYWLCNPNSHQGWPGPLGWRGAERRDRPPDRDDRQRARTSLSITSFYFKPVEPLLGGACCARPGAACRSRCIHSHRDALPATDLAWIAAAASYRRLLDAGVRIYENRHGEHSKIVLIDDAWVAFGSYNFEDAAHDRLAEAMLASRDPRAVAAGRGRSSTSCAGIRTTCG